jgi:hypothetical protein
LHDIFCSGVLHRSNLYGLFRIRLLSIANFILEFAYVFFSFGGDSVDIESHSPSTEPTLSETPRRLS